MTLKSFFLSMDEVTCLLSGIAKLSATMILSANEKKRKTE